MAARPDKRCDPTGKPATPAPRALNGQDQDSPLQESIHDHCQQLRMLESEVRDAQRQIDGLRRDIQDVIRRGEELLKQVE